MRLAWGATSLTMRGLEMGVAVVDEIEQKPGHRSAD
jgi:hypothetical protein